LNKLRALGFKIEDCKLALEVSDNQLDEAALWLTQNAEPVKSQESVAQGLLHSPSIFFLLVGGRFRLPAILLLVPISQKKRSELSIFTT